MTLMVGSFCEGLRKQQLCDRIVGSAARAAETSASVRRLREHASDCASPPMSPTLLTELLRAGVGSSHGQLVLAMPGECM